MNTKFLLAAVIFSLSVGANAAELISKEKAESLKLEKLGTLSVMDSKGKVSSPSDLHEELSKKADAMGAKYYVIVAAREHGPNFEASAIAYK